MSYATGAGKTFTACTFSCRLLKFAKAKRILFLVDRTNLGRQTLKEYQEYDPPGSGRKFDKTYIVQQLRNNRVDPDAKVVITTIQRLYAMLQGRELDEDAEETSSFGTWTTLFTELFPGRTGEWVPKTLIFAKDDNHAEEIVRIVREVFEQGNEFARKITYRTSEDPEALIKASASTHSHASRSR